MSNSSPAIDQEITFTVKVANNGDFDSKDIIISEEILSGFKYLSNITTHGNYDPLLGEWKIDLLKMDTQGYEDQVLQGIGKLIKKIEGIQIELSLNPLYKDQSLFLELYQKIKELGFELWDLQRGFSNIDSGKIYQLDGIFFRNEK